MPCPLCRSGSVVSFPFDSSRIAWVRGKPIQQWQYGCAPHLIFFQSGLNGETEPNVVPAKTRGP
jgi:hypothetical protein